MKNNNSHKADIAGLARNDGKHEDLLLEIYVEEIPASYIEPALEQMKNFAVKNFTDLGLQYGEIHTYATPRRLVLNIESIAQKSQDKIIELQGPSLKAAKDSEGNWTQAANGFAAKNGVAPKDLSVKKGEKDDRLCFVKTVKGLPTKKLLVEILPQLIKNINFPKTMIWEPSAFRFARPIRGIIALYGNNIIKFKIADVSSSNYTFGLHTTDSRKIIVKKPREYMLKLKNRSIIVNQNDRKEALQKSIESAVKSIGAIIPDDALLDEVNELVEYPTAVLCKFDKEYLQLPPEVLTECMKKSQKCFAVQDKKGVFTNYFIDVKNGISQYLDIVRTGYEKVAAARLADAKFFFQNDLENGLEANVEKLKGIIFNKEIGSIYEKIERIDQIAFFINREFGFGAEPIDLKKAVRLSKADLVSEMVFEYPQLQGIIGTIYAKKAGEKDEVAAAISGHYMPLSASGELPKNKLAILISIADKIDSLAASFSVGLEPTGSADPFGLRRAAIGLIRMFIENFGNKDLSGVLDLSFEILPDKVKNNPKFKDAKIRLLQFLWQRIENNLEAEGYDNSDVSAVLNAAKLAKFGSIGLLKLKLDALKAAKTKSDFGKIAEGFKRINNIISQAAKQNNAGADFIDDNLFKDDAERELFEKSKQIGAGINELVKNAQFDAVFDRVLELKPYIDNFFEKIMVMVEDESLKKNRIALLKFIKDIFSNFIDFSELR
ncbi:MAG: glycine--tRNA ligase subunit beta [Elusimicrobiota bacterium]|jgi:glycyl-tRNA synthetase beta chain|nr:glycine--tRNA ligase subunit beta [Elusimicrobiota bacterium]